MKQGTEKRRQHCGQILVLGVAVAYCQTGAFGQVTVVELAQRGVANGVQAGQQVGSAVFGGSRRAAVWSGSAASLVDLSTSSLGSEAFATCDGQQVGRAWANGNPRASLWSGTAASWVNLDPGANDSGALGIGNGHQVGFVCFTGAPHASLWSGSADSWIDLHPVGFLASTAYAIDGDLQVGFVQDYANVFACVWHGTADSWVKLTTTRPWPASQAFGSSGGQQVGYINFETGGPLACTWRGTPASLQIIHPSAAFYSVAYAVDQGQQVGEVYVASASTLQERASLWSGSPESWVDLHADLSADFLYSRALGIWHEGAVTFVVGVGRRAGEDVALMWVSSCFLAECPADFNETCSVTVQDIFDFLAAYFAGASNADFNHSGSLSVQDLFDFLAAYFSGCP